MKALNEHIIMVLFVLLLKRVHFLVNDNDNDNILFVPGISKIQIYNKYTLIHVLTRAIRNSYRALKV